MAHVKGGGATDDRLFSWTVKPNSELSGVIEINQTVTHADDVGVVGQEMPLTVRLNNWNSGPSGKRIKLEVCTRNDNGEIIASDQATLSGEGTSGNTAEYEVTSGNWQGYTTPNRYSHVADDIIIVATWINAPVVSYGDPPAKKIGEAKMDAINISFGSGNTAGIRQGKIYADSKPSKMVANGLYRIPPRVWTKYWVKKEGELAADQWIRVRVIGGSETNGYVELQAPKAVAGQVAQESGAGIYIYNANFDNGLYVGDMRGWTQGVKVWQTQKDNAKQLKLGIYNKINISDPEKALGITEGFSVAALPQNATAGLTRVIEPNKENGAAAGIQVGVEFESDSGDKLDLDNIFLTEGIKLVEDPQNYAGKIKIAGYSPDNRPMSQVAGFVDTHTVRILDFYRNQRTQTTMQLYVFKDLRTGALDIPVSKSGFEISYTPTMNGKIFKLTTTQTGAKAEGKFTIKDDHFIDANGNADWKTTRTDVELESASGGKLKGKDIVGIEEISTER